MKLEFKQSGQYPDYYNVEMNKETMQQIKDGLNHMLECPTIKRDYAFFKEIKVLRDEFAEFLFPTKEKEQK